MLAHKYLNIWLFLGATVHVSAAPLLGNNGMILDLSLFGLVVRHNVDASNIIPDYVWRQYCSLPIEGAQSIYFAYIVIEHSVNPYCQCNIVCLAYQSVVSLFRTKSVCHFFQLFFRQSVCLSVSSQGKLEILMKVCQNSFLYF